MPEDYLSGASLYRDVVTYTEFGEHRTATEADRRTTEWIAAELEAAGLQVQFHPFYLRQFFVHESSLTLGDTPIDCFPLWPPRHSGPQPIRAPLVPFERGADPGVTRNRIALIKIMESDRTLRAARDEMIVAAADAGARAAVIIAGTPSGDLVGSVSADTSGRWPKIRPEPLPIPVVVVGSRDEKTLMAAVAQNAEAMLLVDGKTDPHAEARNVLGRIDRGENLIVVSTPFSGWFRCGGERGPGVALWLALARWAASHQSSTSYLFDCNSGHELFGLGMHAFMEEMAPPPAKVKCWAHLGASIATWGWEQTPSGLRLYAQPERYQLTTGTPEFLPVLTEAFAHLPGLKPFVGPGIGELLRFNADGYRAWGIFGVAGNPYFHAPSDGPETTAPELLEPMALGLVRALEAIETTS